MKILEALNSLKDVEGVYGSFVVNETGQLWHRDLPAVVSNSSLSEAGPRISRLWSIIPDDERPDHVVMEFAAHKLYIQPMRIGSLCVFAPPNVNLLALKMAASFVARGLEKLEEAAAHPSVARSTHTPAADAAQSGIAYPINQAVPTQAAGTPTGEPTASVPQAPSQPPPRKKRTFVYRGLKYEA